MSSVADRPPAAVHVDMDGLTAICRVHGWSVPEGRDDLYKTGTANTLAFLDDMGVKATFFVIADDLDVPEKAASVRQVVRAGHDIGSHTLSHHHLTGLGHDDQLREIRDSRLKLQDKLGVPVRGFRAPAFDMNEQVYRIIADAGYEYDSSLFPSRRSARTVGVDAVPPQPSRLLPDSELTELPMPRYAPLPVPFHASYSLILGTWYFAAGVRRTGDLPFVFLLHLTDLAAPVPANGRQTLQQKFFTISHLGVIAKRARCATMLNKVRATHNFGTTESMLAQSGFPGANGETLT